MSVRKMDIDYETKMDIDYETRSRVNLKVHGVYYYAAHISTDVVCMGYQFPNEDPEQWIRGTPFPQRVLEFFNAGYPRSIHAHNAQFERLITLHVLPRYVTFTQPPLEAWYCTAAQARARNMPGALGDLGLCLESIVRSKSV